MEVVNAGGASAGSEAGGVLPGGWEQYQARHGTAEAVGDYPLLAYELRELSAAADCKYQFAAGCRGPFLKRGQLHVSLAFQPGDGRLPHHPKHLCKD